MMSEGQTAPLERDLLIAEARRRTGLEDIGDPWFHEPLDAQLASLNREAQLTETGARNEAERLIANLANRLMRVKLLKAHPEILDEDIKVGAAIISLARTGSTKTHRMLDAAPGHTSMKTWEGFFPLPLDDEEFGKPVERRRRAQAILDTWPDMSHIHPITLDTPEEEALILDQSFVGMVFETFVWGPGFGEYLEAADQSRGYQELKTNLQILQWQDPARRGKAWILKSPTHMSAPQTLLDTFPGSLMIQTHRDPLRSIPSHCSMVTQFVRSKSNAISTQDIGRATCRRWAKMSEDVLDLRDRIGDDRFIDIQYQDLTEQPLSVAREVFERLGSPMTEADEAAINKWLVDNKREKWAPHVYDLDTYGLTEETIKADFARYRERHCA
jgi:hypothetical protein